MRQILDKEDRFLRPIFGKVPCGLQGRAKFRHGPDAWMLEISIKTVECIESEMTSARFQNKPLAWFFEYLNHQRRPCSATNSRKVDVSGVMKL